MMRPRSTASVGVTMFGCVTFFLLALFCALVFFPGIRVWLADYLTQLRPGQ